MTFNAANWNQPQQVTVSGLDDGLPDGDTIYHVVIAVDPLSDPNYTCAPALQIEAINLNHFVFENGFE
jgi:hypothetical protein